MRYEGDSGNPYALPTPAAREGDHVRVKGKVVSQRDGKGLTNAVIGESDYTLAFTTINFVQNDVAQRRTYLGTDNL